jgi:glucosylceramidase
LVTAVQNPDGVIAVVLFNQTNKAKGIQLNLKGKATQMVVSAKAIQTILISDNN